MHAFFSDFSSAATIEYPVSKLAALGCQLRYFVQVNKPFCFFAGMDVCSVTLLLRFVV